MRWKSWLLLLLIATSLTACSRRRKWDQSESDRECRNEGQMYSYYFGSAPEGRFNKKFESPDAAAGAAKSDGCTVHRALLASVIACCPE